MLQIRKRNYYREKKERKRKSYSYVFRNTYWLWHIFFYIENKILNFIFFFLLLVFIFRLENISNYIFFKQQPPASNKTNRMSEVESNTNGKVKQQQKKTNSHKTNLNQF